MVSDDTSPYIFVGAVAEATPNLEKAIIAQVGTHYTRIDTSAYPVREAKPASRIVYFDTAPRYTAPSSSPCRRCSRRRVPPARAEIGKPCALVPTMYTHYFNPSNRHFPSPLIRAICS
jgi:hypothetical protein